MFDDGNKQALEVECAGFRRMVERGRGVEAPPDKTDISGIQKYQ